MYAMDKLRAAMSYPHDLGRTTDLTKEGLALQEGSTQHSLQQLSHDPSFAERAAKYSTFGASNFPQAPIYSSVFVTGELRSVLEKESKISRSANISTALGALSNGDAQPLPEANFRDAGDGGANVALSSEETKLKFHRNQLNSGVGGIEGAKASTNQSNEGIIFQENSVCSQQAPTLATAHRKRKGNSSAEGKDKSSEGSKLMEASTDNSAPLKRHKSDGEDVRAVKAEQASASENSGDSISPRSTLKGATSKRPQDFPKQDYIHVRARRGQATDSHSLAERVRREKISERMKFLQDLVPGCSKVTGKAVMLDEIINYVQSLQRQVEFLSMKLATVNVPRLDYSYDLLSKEMPMQSRSPETTLLGPDPLAAPFGDHSQCSPMQSISTPSCHFEALYLRRSMSVPTMMSRFDSAGHFSDLFSQV
uniref:BHLH domain-containing protein n=1 Tax=Physcomitrium patens TaxID=3218 RepID=A0A2K1IA37_PHYPA|nr:hypothetical protein PHYPA_030716 [Physcomitrium patens]